MVLTDEVKPIPYPTLTFEGYPSNPTDAQTIAAQDATWDNSNGTTLDIVNNRIAKPGSFGGSANGSYVMGIQKTSASTGAFKLLKVMSGDQIALSLQYMYLSNSANNSSANGLATLGNSLLGALNSSTVVTQALKSGASTIVSNTQANPSVIQKLAGENSTSASNLPPECYLHVLFFDERFTYDAADSYTQQVAANVANITEPMNPKMGTLMCILATKAMT
jgi:hypothetical protein